MSWLTREGLVIMFLLLLTLFIFYDELPLEMPLNLLFLVIELFLKVSELSCRAN